MHVAPPNKLLSNISPILARMFKKKEQLYVFWSFQLRQDSNATKYGYSRFISRRRAAFRLAKLSFTFNCTTSLINWRNKSTFNQIFSLKNVFKNVKSNHTCSNYISMRNFNGCEQVFNLENLELVASNIKVKLSNYTCSNYISLQNFIGCELILEISSWLQAM